MWFASDAGSRSIVFHAGGGSVIDLVEAGRPSYHRYRYVVWWVSAGISVLIVLVALLFGYLFTPRRSIESYLGVCFVTAPLV